MMENYSTLDEVAVAARDLLESEIGKIAAELESEVADLRRLQQLIQKNPAMAERLRTALGSSGKSSGVNGRRESAGTRPGVGGTHFQQVRDFLLSKNNEPQSAPVMIAATGLTRTQVSTVLYKKPYKDEFESLRKEGSNRPLWRLKNPEGRVAH